ncbi:MAG: hypothetical protein ACYC5M_08795 [Anaerolineae bacterium]
MTSFDWSAPRLLPVDVRPEEDGLTLHAGGATLTIPGPLFRTVADGDLRAQWSIEHTAGRELVTLHLNLTADETLLLERVVWLPGAWEAGAERAVQGTDLQRNALFLRRDGVSFVLSLDFPYSEITSEGIAYPPHTPISAGGTYTCHSLTIAACRFSGEVLGDLDRAEIEALSTYVEQRYPQRFERPMFVSACITNRMTDVREGRVFYSMYDNPTLYLDPDLLEQDIRLCAEVGIEYLQLFEGVFDWPDQERTGAAYRRLKALGDSLGVRLGGYVHPQELYCPHYNYSHQRLDRPEWRMRAKDGSTAEMCLGADGFASLLTERLVAHAQEFGEEIICLDFLGVKPCYAENHGHPAGDVYRQVLNLTNLMAALAATNPEYMVWSNSGNWLQLMPKLTWYNPNVYLTDPHVRNYEPTLNVLKLLGDGRREQMVSVHERYGVPYRHFTNCEYYAFPRSRVHDLRIFEYSFLQGLAVTPNICPAEVRTFVNRIPAPKKDACLAFMRTWMDFVRDHFALWKDTARVGDAPGLGAGEIYAHVAEDHGYLCLVNQNPFAKTVQFTLDGAIGLAKGETFAVYEIYPRVCPLAEQPLPYARFGDTITCQVPPEGVRYLEVRPAVPQDGLQVLGLPAEVKPTATGYRLAVSAPQGEQVVLGLVFPEGQGLVDVSARQRPTVPMFTFPADARILQVEGRGARIQVTFPRGRAPRALTHWTVSPGEVAVELPQMGACPFLGGLVSGAFSESYVVEVDLTVGPAEASGSLPALDVPGDVAPQTLPHAPRQTFRTTFDLPFIEPPRWGCMPGCEQDAVLELAFAEPDAVAEIGARLNGKTVLVQRYAYPRKPQWGSHYIELTGYAEPGQVELEVYITWKH